jgi:hypothetical protein
VGTITILEFLARQDIWRVACQLASEPATLDELEAATGLRRGKVRAALKLLTALQAVDESKEAGSKLFVANEQPLLEAMLRAIAVYTKQLYGRAADESLEFLHDLDLGVAVRAYWSEESRARTPQPTEISPTLLLLGLARACYYADHARLQAAMRHGHRGDPDRPPLEDVASAAEVAKQLGNEYVDDRYTGPTEGRVRALLRLQVAADLVTEVKTDHGLKYSLTITADDLLDDLAADGRLPALPESPEHRSWRRQYEWGQHHEEQFRRELGEAATELSQLAGAQEPAELWGEDRIYNRGHRAEEAVAQLCRALTAQRQPEPTEWRWRQEVRHG